MAVKMPEDRVAKQKALLEPFLVSEKHPPADNPTKYEFTALCPIHETPGESRPSAEICLDDGHGGQMWYCHVCDVNFGIDELIKRMIARSDYAEILRVHGEGGKVYDFGTKKRLQPKAATPTMEQWQASKCTRALLNRPDLMKVLKENRGLTPESIIEFGIGWLESRKAFTIPVYGRDKVKRGELSEPTNVKLAFHPPLPGKIVNGKRTKPTKYMWYAAGVADKPLLFGDLIQPGDEVLVVEGEWDAILARQLGFNAVSATRGAKKWEQADTDTVAGCHVTVLMDNDTAGRTGAATVERSIKKSKSALSLRVVTHDVTGADFCDLVVKHHWDKAEFDAIIEAAPVLPLHKIIDLPTKGTLVSFDDLTSRNSGKEVVESTVMINAKVGHSKLAWRGTVSCGVDQGKKCESCPLQKGSRTFELRRTERDHYLPMIGVEDRKVHLHLKQVVAERPLGCTKFEVEREEDIDVEHLVVTSPALGQTEEGSNSGKVTSLFLIGSHNSKFGDVIKVVGTCEADAKKQDAVFMAWYSESNNPLTHRRVLTDEEREALSIFQSPGDPYQNALDIAGSILRQHSIVGREELGAAYLLTYASVLDFPFRKRVFPGWMQGMVVGDTRTGKSMVMKALVKHIGLGTDINCDVATRAGIVGGQTTHNGSYYAKMGLMPRADRQLVFLDESTNIMASGELMKYLTGARTNGYVEVHQVNAGRWDCRVRQVWIANPPEGKSINQFPYKGIDAIKALITDPQDVARFDWLYATTTNDDTTRQINTETITGEPSIYTPELLRIIIAWLWTRLISDIVIMPEVEEYIGKVAQRVGERYKSEKFKIMPGEEVGVKIARMAIAHAGINFSTTNGVNLVVEKRHVDAAEKFIDTMFGSDELGFADFCLHDSKRVKHASKFIEWFEERIRDNDDYHNAASWLVENLGQFRKRDFEDGSGIASMSSVVFELKSRGLLLDEGGPYLSVSKPAQEMLRRLRADEIIGRMRVPPGN